ncbi:MAG TPA: ChaN family lipoprotein [Fimbriimonas sp.]
MPVFAALAIAAAMQNPPDPLRLDIGRKGTVRAEFGLTDLAAGRTATIASVVSAARGKRFVYLGENHATQPHQQFQADVIRALATSGRPVAVGLEMITRPKQDPLDAWVRGELSEAEFQANVDWKGQWGFDYGFYKPVFDVAKEMKLPMVALNVPRDWVRLVGRTGLSALPVSARLQLPNEFFTGNKDHRRVFEALMGGHPMTGPGGDNIYSAQVLWDVAMADTALKWLERFGAKDQVFVVLAGSGHVMYDQGISYRVERRRGGDGITVVMGQAEGPVEVSKGLGDFFLLSPSPNR